MEPPESPEPHTRERTISCPQEPFPLAYGQAPSHRRVCRRERGWTTWPGTASGGTSRPSTSAFSLCILSQPREGVMHLPVTGWIPTAYAATAVRFRKGAVLMIKNQFSALDILAEETDMTVRTVYYRGIVRLLVFKNRIFGLCVSAKVRITVQVVC